MLKKGIQSLFLTIIPIHWILLVKVNIKYLYLYKL